MRRAFFLILIAIAVSKGQSAPTTNALPSDAEIQQKMTGTWRIDQKYLKSELVIASNGNYVCHITQGVRADTPTNRLEGTFQIRDGFVIDTLTKSSIPSEPTPLLHTNRIVRVNDHELVWERLDMGGLAIFRKVDH